MSFKVNTAVFTLKGSNFECKVMDKKSCFFLNVKFEKLRGDAKLNLYLKM